MVQQQRSGSDLLALGVTFLKDVAAAAVRQGFFDSFSFLIDPLDHEMGKPGNFACPKIHITCVCEREKEKE